MPKSLLKEVSIDELAKMRESGMTNRDIANTLNVSVATIYKYIGAQPQWGRMSREIRAAISDREQSSESAQDDAALVVENKSISLAGLFAGYTVDIKSKRVRIFVEDGVDALIVPFDQVQNFANELRAISSHIEGLKIDSEMW